jgi:hypothetical protein
MQFLAFCARHPWLRNGLVLLMVAVVLYGGARLWTSGPDAVHITITHVDGHDGMRPATKTVTYDRTIHDGAVAQRLQRDLATIPIQTDHFAAYTCPRDHQTYDAYTLTWYRAGLPVEHASADRTGCDIWLDDGVFFHVPAGADALYADIAAALRAGR